MNGADSKTLRLLADKIRGLFTRASVLRVRAATDDRPAQLQVDLGGGKPRNGVAYPQPYGFGSYPLPGAEAFLAMPAAGGGRGWALITDDRRGRPQLIEGEAVIYNAVTGNQLRLGSDGRIHATGSLVVEGDIVATGTIAGAGGVTSQGPLTAAGGITAVGDITTTGELSDATGTVQEIRDIFDVHTHTSAGTGPPVPNFGGGN